MLYNDAYSTFAGGRHPHLLGSRVREGWEKVANFNDNVMRVGLAGGTLAYRDQELTLHRQGRPKQVFMNLDYSPVCDEHGQPAGVLAIVVETTERVLGERRQAFLSTLETRLRDMDDPVAMTAEAAAALGRQMGVAQVGFGEVDAAGRHVTVEREWSDGRIPSVIGTWRMEDFGAAFAAVLKAGRTAAIEDVRTNPRTCAREIVAAYDGIATGAILDVPLLRSGRMAAILFVHHPEPRSWTVDEITLAEDVVARLASAVERARAEAARDRAAALSAAQNRVLELAVGDATLNQTLEAIVATVESLSTSEVLTSILLLDKDGVHLRHGAAPSLPAAYNDAIDGIVVGPDVGSCGAAVHRGAPVFVADIAADPLWTDYRELALRHGLRACWSIPIRSSQGAMVGTFAMYHREPREPVSADLQMVDFVVRTAGLVIERSTAEAGLRESKARLRFVSALEDRLFASADAAEAMFAATRMLGERLGASRCAYADVDADGDRFWIRKRLYGAWIGEFRRTYNLDLFGPLTATDLRAGRTLVVRDVATELAPGQGREMFQAIGIGAIVCCPLIKDGRLTAMMAVHQNGARAWTADEISLVKVVERC